VSGRAAPAAADASPPGAAARSRLERYADLDRANLPYLSWQLEQFLPYLGQRVLELGCGVGGLLELLGPREYRHGLDVDPEVLEHARERFRGRPGFGFQLADLGRLGPEEVAELAGRRFDSVLCVNLLEHVEDDRGALATIERILAPGGILALLVPAHPALYGAWDRLDGHHRRYTRAGLARLLAQSGLRPVRLHHFNAVGAIGWWIQYRLLRRRVHGPGHFRLMNRLLPLLRALERWHAPPFGLSLVAVCRKPGPPGTAEARPVEASEREFFERHYAEGAAHPTGLRLRMRRELRLLRAANRGRRLGRVLSVGCGEGLFEIGLAADAEAVVGLDLSEGAIGRARRRAALAGVRNVEFRCLPLAELRWDEPFDAIVCLAFLHHLPGAELPGFLREACRHLRPGGFFYAQDPNRNGWLRKVGRRLLGSRYDRYHSPDERELDPGALRGQLLEAGFASAEVSYHDLTLIPAQYLVPRGLGWCLHLCAAIDRVFCASPLAPRASGFGVFARVGDSSAQDPPSKREARAARRSRA
jgi:SAM-dependent methyltransferase